MRALRVVIPLVWAVLLAACPKPATTPEDLPDTRVPSDTGSQTGVPSPGVPSGRPLTAEERRLAAEREALQQNIIYFEFDKSDIRSEFMPAITAHARFLAANSGTAVRLEGHADERGTREYNIGLGERRAQAVRRALALGGAANAQITTVSYGEERPAVRGSDESSWWQNRRVEIVYAR